jgi:TetR/AcrR family transcriptional repressor of nem operon
VVQNIYIIAFKNGMRLPMARPREFDIDQALEKATQVFWSKGYEAASLSDLTSAMGLSKSSLYGTFGSKHELFLATLDYYNRTVTTQRVAALIAGGDSTKSGISRVFNELIDDLLSEKECRGCFVTNCAVEVAACDPAAAKRVSAGLVHLEDTFFRAVKRGQDGGEISTSRDPRALARYLTSSLNGLIVMAKADPDRQALKDVVEVILSTLD